MKRLGDKGAVVLTLTDDIQLISRHTDFRKQGASHDFPNYQPHITITYNGNNVDINSIKPFTGDIYLGPEHFSQVKDDWSSNIKEVAMSDTDFLDKAIVVSIPTIVKARPSTADGRRIVEVEASPKFHV